MAGSIEDIVMQYGSRGMNTLYPFLPKESYRKAAEDILKLSRGNFPVTTGFYAKGAGETDGPLGAWILIQVFEKLGFLPILVTDQYTYYYFSGEKVKCVRVPLRNSREYNKILSMETILGRLNPVGMLSVERCGKNGDGDYTNMKGESIGIHTAPIDELFELAPKYGIKTFGIGDGGNEIGMGKLSEEISRYLSLSPCIVKTDHLLIATVSNWAAYGLGRALEVVSGKHLMPPVNDLKYFFDRIVRMGSVDGITGENTMTVDGFPQGKEVEMYLEILSFS